MGLSAAKRKAEVIDLTKDDADNLARHRSKNGRITSTTSSNVSNGQRLGQDSGFVPLSQASLVSGYDEDDEGAIQIIQNSQGFDDAAYSSYQLYGQFCRISCFYDCKTASFVIDKISRKSRYQDCRCAVLSRLCYLGRACYFTKRAFQ
jgi:hypothetical protein